MSMEDWSDMLRAREKFDPYEYYEGYFSSPHALWEQWRTIKDLLVMYPKLREDEEMERSYRLVAKEFFDYIEEHPELYLYIKEQLTRKAEEKN